MCGSKAGARRRCSGGRMDPTESKERRGQRYICGMPPVQDANSAGPLVVNLLQTLEGHQGAVYDLCLDGQGALVSAGGDGLLVQWPRNAEAFNSQGKALAKAGSPVFSLRALPDGGLEAGTAGGELLTVMEDGDWQGEMHHEGGTYVVSAWGTGGADGRWVSRLSETPETEWRQFEGRIRCALRGETGVLVGTSEGEIHHVGAGWKVKAHEGAVRSLLHWPGKAAMASVGGDGRLCIWQAQASGKWSCMLSIDAHKGAAYRALPSPDGRWVATCSRDRSIAIWNAETLALALRIARPVQPGHMRSVNALCWTSENQLASAGDDGRILIWSLGTDEATSDD